MVFKAKTKTRSTQMTLVQVSSTKFLLKAEFQYNSQLKMAGDHLLPLFHSFSLYNKNLLLVKQK